MGVSRKGDERQAKNQGGDTSEAAGCWHSHPHLLQHKKSIQKFGFEWQVENQIFLSGMIVSGKPED